MLKIKLYRLSIDLDYNKELYSNYLTLFIAINMLINIFNLKKKRYRQEIFKKKTIGIFQHRFSFIYIRL